MKNPEKPLAFPDFFVLLYTVFAHVNPAVGQKCNALCFQKRTAKLCVFSAGDRAVGAHNALPRDIIRTAAHRPADLTRRARRAELPRYLPVGYDFAARDAGNYLIYLLKK